MPRIKLLRLAERSDHGVTVTLLSDGDTALVRVREESIFGCFDVRTSWAKAHDVFFHPYLSAPAYIPLPRYIPESDEVQAHAATITPAEVEQDGGGQEVASA